MSTNFLVYTRVDVMNRILTQDLHSVVLKIGRGEDACYNLL